MQAAVCQHAIACTSGAQEEVRRTDCSGVAHARLSRAFHTLRCWREYVWRRVHTLGGRSLDDSHSSSHRRMKVSRLTRGHFCRVWIGTPRSRLTPVIISLSRGVGLPFSISSTRALAHISRFALVFGEVAHTPSQLTRDNTAKEAERSTAMSMMSCTTVHRCYIGTVVRIAGAAKQINEQHGRDILMNRRRNAKEALWMAIRT